MRHSIIRGEEKWGDHCWGVWESRGLLFLSEGLFGIFYAHGIELAFTGGFSF